MFKTFVSLLSGHASYVAIDVSELPVRVSFTLKMKAPRFLESAVTVHQSTGRNNQEDVYIQRQYVTCL
jgi:hypothetical protein